jgi:hypothetical protein
MKPVTPMRAVARFAGEPRLDVVVVPGKAAPHVEGSAACWTTPGGKPITYPNAYKWPKVYHHSTVHVEVGAAWVERYANLIAAGDGPGLSGLPLEYAGITHLAALRTKGGWCAAWREKGKVVVGFVAGSAEGVPKTGLFHAKTMASAKRGVDARIRAHARSIGLRDRARAYASAGCGPLQARMVALWERARRKVVTLEHARQAGLCGPGVARFLERIGLHSGDVGAGVMVGAALLGVLNTPVVSDAVTMDLFLRALEQAAV